MNKKEVLEIRKQFSPDNSTITRICGCYVDHEKNKRFVSKKAFHSLSEEESFKYYDIFRQTLSGTVGKNLIHMEFPLDQEMEGGTQEFLLKLRNSKLEDDALLDAFYNKIIETYFYAENYYIILIHANYDIPSKATDGMEMFDSSDTVYEYILCSICPVNLSKAGLAYSNVENDICERNRDWVVDAPQKGFLFPAFTDRETDIHGVMYYSKKPEDLQADLITELLGAFPPMTAGTQKEAFQSIISNTLGEDCDYEVVKNIHETLNEMIEEKKDDPEPLIITQNEMKHIFQESGVPTEKMDTFEQDFSAAAGAQSKIMATNVASTKNFNIETPDIIIKVNPERADLVETRIIDNRQCLVIAVDDHIEVNGINVRTISPRKANEHVSSDDKQEYQVDEDTGEFYSL